MSILRQITKRSFVAPAAAAAFLTITSASAADLSGTWKNMDTATHGVTQIAVSFSSPHQIDIWGKCSPKDCDWGIQSAVFSPDGTTLTAHYVSSFAVRDVEVHLLPNPNRATYTISTVFTDKSGRANYTMKGDLRRELK